MVTIDKIQRGVSRYLDEQLMGKMKGLDAWTLPGFATLYLSNLPTIMKDMAAKPVFAYSGLFAADGTVDIERLINSFKPAARKSPATIKLPISNSPITFNEQDLDMLLRYIQQS